MNHTSNPLITHSYQKRNQQTVHGQSSNIRATFCFREFVDRGAPYVPRTNLANAIKIFQIPPHRVPPIEQIDNLFTDGTPHGSKSSLFSLCFDLFHLPPRPKGITRDFSFAYSDIFLVGWRWLLIVLGTGVSVLCRIGWEAWRIRHRSLPYLFYICIPSIRPYEPQNNLTPGILASLLPFSYYTGSPRASYLPYATLYLIPRSDSRLLEIYRGV
ncbi:hypothetical protein K474DRAFT_959433 [Panus rudis PR-1116 ss-1]|nr:hypothetical protein K474DRAFT_959433 [Panus rudis PR-1116 ss-1]